MMSPEELEVKRKTDEEAAKGEMRSEMMSMLKELMGWVFSVPR